MPTQTEEQRQRALADAGVAPSSLPAATQNALPTASTPIDVSALGSTPPFTLPPAPEPQSYDLSTLPTITALANPPKSQTEIDQDALGKKALEDTAKLGTKAAAQINAEEDAGLPALNSQLNDINAQIRDLTTASVAAYNKSEDRLAPTFAIRGEQAQIERQRSVKALGLSAMSQAIQGNIALAQDRANRAIEVEFGPVQAELDYLNKALDLNKDKLSREDAQRAEQLQIQLGERQRLLDEAKENKQIIYGWTAEAAKNGASSLVINQALSANSPTQALSLLSDFLSDPIAKQQAILNLQLTRSQIAKNNADANSTGTSVDAGNVLAYAQQYAATGQIPTGLPKGTFGVIADVAKSLPKPPGTLVDINTGIKPANLSATTESGITSLYDVVNKLDDLKSDFGDTSTGLLAGLKNAVLPSDANQRYNDLRAEIVDLLARARTGAVINADEQRNYEAKLPGNFNKTFWLGPDGNQLIEDLKRSITGKLDATLANNGTAIYGYTTVNVGGTPLVVGQTVQNDKGQTGRVNPDGSITLLQ